MIDSAQVRAFGGGDRSGPSPVDRRKPGTKYTVLVDARGTPLVMQTAPANVSDHRQILSTIIRFPRIGGTRGRPRHFPKTLYADAGYDSDDTRLILMMLGITPVIRRRNMPHGSQLGNLVLLRLLFPLLPVLDACLGTVPTPLSNNPCCSILPSLDAS